MSDPPEYGLDKVWEKIQDDLELEYGDKLSDEYEKKK